jgi:HTH-type transcriptional regulator/antitoxin HigA
MAIKHIRTDSDYEMALARIDELFGARPGSPEGDELEVLVDLVEHYEEKHVPIGHPTALEAIRFRMEQGELTQRDLVPLIGSRAKVSEILSGKRRLTLPMARALHEHLGIPAEALLREAGGAETRPEGELEWERFPLAAMAKRGFIPKGARLKARAEALVRDLIRRAGGKHLASSALFRENASSRANAKTDPYALLAWCLQVLAKAREASGVARYRKGTVTPEFLREVARLSNGEDGPRKAQEYLAARGIRLVIVPHLPRTHLDGAALQLEDGRPVIGLTLRYDRLDSFWFCLLHELAHVGLHLDHGAVEPFIDDLSLRGIPGEREDRREREADQWAEEALVPADAWERSEARVKPTASAILRLAGEVGVHPAIVAGRVRYERRDYRLLSQFVGSREVRRQFGV